MTITADEKVLKWARLQAAEKGISVSRLVGQMLEGQMQGNKDYWQAYERWKKIKPFLKGRIEKMNREELYDRSRR